MVGKKKTNNAPSNSPEDNLANLQLRGGASVQSSTLPRLNRNNIVSAFNDYFGNATKLENWQRLCRDIGVDDELPSITKCKQALVPVWVNIHDLVYAVRNNTTPPRRFPSEHALAAYTRKNRRYYPKQKAKDGGPVRALLAHIF